MLFSQFGLEQTGRGLFFMVHVAIDSEVAKNIFQCCFGGVEKTGWAVNYEKIESGTSIWDLYDKSREINNY